jgi:hypothetical protein
MPPTDRISDKSFAVFAGTIKSLRAFYRTGYSRSDVSPEVDREWGGFCA